MSSLKKLSPSQQAGLLDILRSRLDTYMHRHPGLHRAEVAARLQNQPAKPVSLHEMEATGVSADRCRSGPPPRRAGYIQIQP